MIALHRLRQLPTWVLKSEKRCGPWSISGNIWRGKVGCIINTVNKPKNTKNNAKLGKSVSILSFHILSSINP